MLVSLNAGIAYLAMPKTGSTAIETALMQDSDIVMSGHPNLKHMRLRRFERFVRPLLQDYEVDTVAVIREPIEWLGSWYRYRARDALAGKPQSTASLSFEQFITDWMMDDPPIHARVGRPAEFLAAPQGGTGITHLFRYESFDALVSFLEARFNRKLSLQMINVSPKMDLDLSADLRRALDERLRPEFDLYDGAV